MGTLYIVSMLGTVIEGKVRSYDAACKIAQAIEDGWVSDHVDLFRSCFHETGRDPITLNVSERS